MAERFYFLYFYVPKSHLLQVKKAIFAAGAGKIGNYSQCAWQTLGEGQFCPEKGSSPYLGKIKKIQKVAEYKVEVICKARVLNNVVAALKKAHPYETPAYGFFAIKS